MRYWWHESLGSILEVVTRKKIGGEGSLKIFSVFLLDFHAV